MGVGALSLGGESGRSVNLNTQLHIVPSSWRYTSTPQYDFMEWCLVKYRDKFIFTFTIPKEAVSQEDVQRQM
jgi:hypothetical protein